MAHTLEIKQQNLPKTGKPRRLVIVELLNGLATVHGLPEGYEVEIRDYDYIGNDFYEDEQGREYTIQ